MNNNAFSVDNLVEFGMSVAVANQMINSMNSVISNTTIPGANNPTGIKVDPNSVYYIAIDNKPAGPFTVPEISRLISDKKINKDTLVWKPGMPSWETAEKIPEVLRIVALTPPPIPQ